MSTPPMPPGPQDPQAPQPQGQPYPQAPQGQPYPPQGQFPGQQQPFQGGQVPPPGGPVPGTGPLPGQPQGFPQAPVGAPPKKSRRLLASIGGAVGVIVVVLIVRAVIGLGVGTVASSTDDAHNTAVGECASVTGTTTKPNYDKVDCASGKQNYIVGVVLKSNSDTCPDGYDSYYEEGTLNNVKLCLAPVLEDGKCYDLSSTGTDMGYTAKSCTDPSVLQIKVIKDKADKSACGAGGDALVYDPLKLTYCVAAPTGS
ncbi:hypothetical protein [Kutzneria sp. NPDC052558]|uniref:LppU/SCO3897 family protein n=1 Tax=Kutzneria sp. NPDC052558 TaxID=3364121 RepID=UPI0037C99F9F